jgi:hypothetical protein
VRSQWLVLVLIFLFGGGQRGYSQVSQQQFDHFQHRKLFPSCGTCHAGAEAAGREIWPASADCANCHDGKVEEKVDWREPRGLPRTNLRFAHPAHAKAVRRATDPDSVVACQACHSLPGDPMRVRLAVVRNCLDCHRIQTAHFSAPDSSCAKCHLPLAQATRLTRKEVAEFPVPDSHERSDFVFDVHGKLARAGGRGGERVSASCATCHARNFCIECHVNAPEVPVIQALGPDPRSTAHEAELEAPASHRDPEFLFRHGGLAQKSPSSCTTCHTQESCMACHMARPGVVQALPVAGPGRGKGANVRRARPVSHGQDFSDTHGPVADARPVSCEGCHVRPQCLDCHRPNPADAAPSYHPAGFLSRHPSSAHTRETSCSDCHNTGQFCADCHVKSGLSAQGPLNAGYHDAKRSFLLGHGQAARQNLESCVACHAERDCLTCHSALGGRRFNPHGPGFDPARLREKNSQVCTACHGASIPDPGR